MISYVSVRNFCLCLPVNFWCVYNFIFFSSICYNIIPSCSFTLYVFYCIIGVSFYVHGYDEWQLCLSKLSSVVVLVIIMFDCILIFSAILLFCGCN